MTQTHSLNIGINIVPKQEQKPTGGGNTAQHCIERLADASATPQHERITDMLTFYGVDGVIYLTDEQIIAYTTAILGKE